MSVDFEYKYMPAVRYSAEYPHKKLFNIISANDEQYQSFLKDCEQFIEPLSRIKFAQRDVDSDTEPYWGNNFFSSLDAISLYCILATRNPHIYLEVGSGNSTKFAKLAIKNHNLRTKIISIDPFPRAEIDAICDTVIRNPVEFVSPSTFQDLPDDTVLFVDNSHRSFQNSDVTQFFLEALPSLKEGIICGLHDIFLPYDYPKLWVSQERFYNEQYLLAAYLLGGHVDSDVFFPCHYIAQVPSFSSVREKFSEKIKVHSFGGCFWLKKTVSPLQDDLQTTNAFLGDLAIRKDDSIGANDPRFVALLKAGWSVPERGAVWSIGNQQTISFNPTLLGQVFHITLFFTAFVCEQHKMQHYIFCDKNNNILTKITVNYPDKNFSVKLRFDASSLRDPEGNIDIFILAKDAVSPLQVNYSTDSRQLGLALRSVLFSE